MLLDDIGGGLAPGGDREAHGAVRGLDLHHQCAEHVDPEALPRPAVFGVSGHRRGDVIVDPVARALIVIVRSPRRERRKREPV